ncbi:hypothetical protein KQI84_07425 [bacterium]|nr:hypothetical protein [bacterium]
MTAPAPLTNWRVVLVSPQTAANVGAVARAMKNFGCHDLAVVDPRCDLGIEGPAGQLARSAYDIIASRREVETLGEALADVHFSIALTAQEGDDRRREFIGFVPEPLLRDRPAAETRALVFGREDSGLTSDECGLCGNLWGFPTQPEYTSMNLAQAVTAALVGVSEAQTRGAGDENAEAPAPHEEVEAMFAHLRQVLDAAGYERGVPVKYPERVLRRVALRARLRHGEVQILRGIYRRVLNAILGFERRS